MSSEEINQVESQAKDPEQGREQGPASDIRRIQALLANGIFPGNVAPAVVQAYNTLEQMAVKIEQAEAKAVAEKPTFTEALKAEIASEALNDTASK